MRSHDSNGAPAPLRSLTLSRENVFSIFRLWLRSCSPPSEVQPRAAQSTLWLVVIKNGSNLRVKLQELARPLDSHDHQCFRKGFCFDAAIGDYRSANQSLDRSANPWIHYMTIR